MNASIAPRVSDKPAAIVKGYTEAEAARLTYIQL